MHSRRWQEQLRQAAEAEGLRAVASVRLGERNALPGTPIPVGFPWRASLLAAGYRATEDLPHPASEGREDAARELARLELVPADAGDDADSDHLLSTLGFVPEDD